MLRPALRGRLKHFLWENIPEKQMGIPNINNEKNKWRENKWQQLQLEW
jgi:hypothetical protein